MAALLVEVVTKLAGVKAGLLGLGFALSLVFVDTRFSNTITLGAVLITIAVGVGTIVSLVYGVRYRSINRVLSNERDVYQERAQRFEHDMAEYREKKHEQITDLTAQLKASQGQLELEKMKHDFTPLMERVDLLDTDLRARTEYVRQIMDVQREHSQILQSVADTMEKVAQKLGE